jgi:hypothetical protein
MLPVFVFSSWETNDPDGADGADCAAAWVTAPKPFAAEVGDREGVEGVPIPRGVAIPLKLAGAVAGAIEPTPLGVAMPLNFAEGAKAPKLA